MNIKWWDSEIYCQGWKDRDEKAVRCARVQFVTSGETVGVEPGMSTKGYAYALTLDVYKSGLYYPTTCIQ